MPVARRRGRQQARGKDALEPFSPASSARDGAAGGATVMNEDDISMVHLIDWQRVFSSLYTYSVRQQIAFRKMERAAIKHDYVQDCLLSRLLELEDQTRTPPRTAG
jgi:hypothetical protein